MKIEIDVDLENNEGTVAPYWLIIEPRHVIGKITSTKDSVQTIANCIYGVFFSRDSAQKYLNANSHNFSGHAVVYCHTGISSYEYRTACREAEQKQVRDE